MSAEKKTEAPSALPVQELLCHLKIGEVMTRQVFCVSKTDSMRAVRDILKKNDITGLPVVDSGCVLGIVSMSDLMNALEGGCLEDPVSKWMRGEVRTLAEDMPLSFALSAFKRYSFRRFPVVDRDNRLSGMITSRDINLALIRELSRLVSELEDHQEETTSAEASTYSKVFPIQRYDFETGGKAAAEIKRALKGCGLPAPLVRRVAVAAYELEINLVAHSVGGLLGFEMSPKRIEISSHDRGPGIADVKLAMTEGYSTAGEWIRSQGFGAGMGLPNVRRVSDEFLIRSELGLGTMIRAVIYTEQSGGST
jgi:CBS domain-containing protein/anti-sigma regulatory factor (Ser/Thr protein kinase)